MPESPGSWAISSRAASSARSSWRSARPWTASRRVSSSGSSSRAASASRSAGLSRSASVPRANVAQSRTGRRGVGGEADQRVDGVVGLAAAERERDRLADLGVLVVAQAQHPVVAVRLAEVAEGVGDRGDHLRVVLALGHVQQRLGLLLGERADLPRAELAEDEGGELARARVVVGAERLHRLEHVAARAGGQRAHVRLPLVVGRATPRRPARAPRRAGARAARGHSGSRSGPRRGGRAASRRRASRARPAA